MSQWHQQLPSMLGPTEHHNVLQVNLIENRQPVYTVKEHILLIPVTP